MSVSIPDEALCVIYSHAPLTGCSKRRTEEPEKKRGPHCEVGAVGEAPVGGAKLRRRGEAGEMKLSWKTNRVKRAQVRGESTGLPRRGRRGRQPAGHEESSQ